MYRMLYQYRRQCFSFHFLTFFRSFDLICLNCNHFWSIIITTIIIINIVIAQLVIFSILVPIILSLSVCHHHRILSLLDRRLLTHRVLYICLFSVFFDYLGFAYSTRCHLRRHLHHSPSVFTTISTSRLFFFVFEWHWTNWLVSLTSWWASLFSHLFLSLPFTFIIFICSRSHDHSWRHFALLSHFFLICFVFCVLVTIFFCDISFSSQNTFHQIPGFMIIMHRTMHVQCSPEPASMPTCTPSHPFDTMDSTSVSPDHHRHLSTTNHLVCSSTAVDDSLSVQPSSSSPCDRKSIASFLFLVLSFCVWFAFVQIDFCSFI